MLKIIKAHAEGDVLQVRELFKEYEASLGVSLCFQGFEKELASLPGEYAPPEGRLLLALWDGHLAGCVALRKDDQDACEMKRLYVRPQFRGKGVGRTLAHAIIAEAKEIGYKKMRLDTLPSMKAAIALYQSLSFQPAASYRHNPIEGAIFMELALL
jgi:putative acetyltransferase